MIKILQLIKKTSGVWHRGRFVLFNADLWYLASYVVVVKMKVKYELLKSIFIK